MRVHHLKMIELDWVARIGVSGKTGIDHTGHRYIIAIPVVPTYIYRGRQIGVLLLGVEQRNNGTVQEAIKIFK